jgi:hypothetical protein
MTLGEEDFSDAQDLPEETGDDAEVQESDENEESGETDENFDDEQAEESEEESEDAQDDDEEEEKPIDDPSELKNQNGAFDWKKINAKLPSIGPELEKSFKEAQRTTNLAVQEKALLEKQLNHTRESAQELQQQAELLQQFNDIYERSPEVQQAIQRALQGGFPQHGASSGPHGLPPGVDPNDPLVPLIMQQKQVLDQMANQHRQQESIRQQHESREKFKQGLMSAKDTFTQVVGRPPSKEELMKVAEKMRGANILDGSLLVPSLFVDEIRKGAKRDFFKSRDEKKKLPQRPKSSVRPSSTSGRKSLREAFDEAWDEHS